LSLFAHFDGPFVGNSNPFLGFSPTVLVSESLFDSRDGFVTDDFGSFDFFAAHILLYDSFIANNYSFCHFFGHFLFGVKVSVRDV